MQEKRHDRVVEMRLCFFSGKVGDYKMLFVATRKCRSTSGDALLLDVVDHAAESQASDLSAALEGLPWEEKRRILKVVRTLMEE